MNKSLIVVLVFFVSMPLLIIIWYLAAVRWEPMDAISMTLPRSVKERISKALVAKADFDASGLSAARRAVKLDPTSEDAWTMFCATGASDGRDMDRTIQACSHAASMIQTYSLFHSEVIAEAYEEVHRPCDGLPVLRKTMGEEEVNNISSIFAVGRLEVICGQMDDAEEHLRAVVSLRERDLRANHWEDRPPSSDGPPDTYEKAFRLYLSEARQNLSALLAMRHKDAEAFRVCRSALGLELRQCSCEFKPRRAVACNVSDR